MTGTQQVMELTGMSKSRCLQFAKAYGVTKIGQSYVWSDADIKAFRDRIGQRGKKGEKRAEA